MMMMTGERGRSFTECMRVFPYIYTERMRVFPYIYTRKLKKKQKRSRGSSNRIRLPNWLRSTGLSV